MRSDGRPNHTRRLPSVTSRFASNCRGAPVRGSGSEKQRWCCRSASPIISLAPDGWTSYVHRPHSPLSAANQVCGPGVRSDECIAAGDNGGAIFCQCPRPSDTDLDKISSVRKLSIDVMTDITMLSRRPDLSQTDSDCVKSTLRSLTQIAAELQSYEYLITIESELKNFDDDNTLRGVLRFAVENALKILETERRHLVEVSDQCARSPISAEKARQATQFIESTQSVLKSLQPRL
jgi:hypothetical protein